MSHRTVEQIFQRLTALIPNLKPGQDQGVRSETTDSDSAEIYLYGVVGGGGWFSDGFSAKDVVDQLKELDVTNLTARIHSPGGSAWDGVAIMNALKNHKAKVHVVVDGIAASAASVIAMAGDTITMGVGSQMMVHDAWILTIGNEADLLEDAAWVGRQSQNMATIYADHAGGTAEEWREVMRAETWYTAQEAVDAGLADALGGAAAPTDPEAQAALSKTWDLSMFHKPPTASAGGFTTAQEGDSAVAFTDAQMTTMRQELGLPETADEATIVAAMSEALAEQAEAPTSATPKVPEGMVLVEKDVIDSLREGATQGAEARSQQLTEKRDRAISQAIKDGKITKAREAHWVGSWDADPEGAESLLASLEPGLVPVEERGHDQSTNAGSVYDELFKKGA